MGGRFGGDSGKILNAKRRGDLRGTLSKIGGSETLNTLWGGSAKSQCGDGKYRIASTVDECRLVAWMPARPRR